MILLSDLAAAAESHGLQPGQVWEVHVPPLADEPDWPHGLPLAECGSITTVQQFVNDWRHVADEWNVNTRHAYVGVVHEGGAFMFWTRTLKVFLSLSLPSVLSSCVNEADDDDDDGLLLPGYNGRTPDEVAEIANGVVAELPDDMLANAGREASGVSVGGQSYRPATMFPVRFEGRQ